ncbi:MAG TPA: DUF1614 domain-containing protein [Thermodesulfobacteriota bacterium]|nr:DUF1614 domain-containing protein [Thermodesulfobacteriota bacterium]
MFFNPLTFLLMIFFLFIVLFFFLMVEVNVIALVFAKIGIPPRHIFASLFLILIGSFINIPIKKFPQETMINERSVSFFGIRYRIPPAEKPETVLAVNLGGAVIPCLLSFYLFFKTGLWVKGLAVTAIMVFVTHRLAKPIKGVGIAMPAFIPPIIAAVFSVIFSYDYAPVLAYIGGTLGTLIGADILNVSKIKNLGAPVASIGGAGTFDGIFLSGIMAVLLAAILT